MHEELGKALKDDEAVRDFVASLRDFNQLFCDAIVSKVDFTIKMEVHGDNGVMLHARVLSDSFRRPKGAEKRKHRNR